MRSPRRYWSRALPGARGSMEDMGGIIRVLRAASRRWEVPSAECRVARAVASGACGERECGVANGEGECRGQALTRHSALGTLKLLRQDQLHSSILLPSRG